MKKILIVDDAMINREMIKDIFEGEFEPIEAENGAQAIEVLQQEGENITIVFLDLVMPEKDGLDVLKYMRSVDLIERIPVIMITGESTIESDVKTYEYGAADIIYKPIAPEVVKRRAYNLIKLFEKQEDIEAQLEAKTEQLRASQEKLAKNSEFLINALGSVVEFKSNESGEHIQRVTGLTKILMKQLVALYPEYKLSKEQIHMISQAAALHDVGKIAIPDSILNKPARLTAEEYEEMKKHSSIGCEILERFKQEDSEFYQYCHDICRWHHEKYDGKGYPDGLKGNEIPIWAQVVSVADCFDALSSPRVYKAKFDMETAYTMIREGKCGVFSEELMNSFEAAKEAMFREMERTGV